MKILLWAREETLEVFDAMVEGVMRGLGCGDFERPCPVLPPGGISTILPWMCVVAIGGLSLYATLRFS